MTVKLIDDDYLGDGVYASFDGYHIALDLRGQGSEMKIALEPQVFAALLRYKTRVDDAIKELQKERKEKPNANDEKTQSDPCSASSSCT